MVFPRCDTCLHVEHTTECSVERVGFGGAPKGDAILVKADDFFLLENEVELDWINSIEIKCDRSLIRFPANQLSSFKSKCPEPGVFE